MIICKKCGNEFESGKFCPECGTPVALEQPEIIQPEVTFVQPVQQYVPQPVEVKKPGKGKGVASMILGILSFITSCGLIGLIFAIISFFLGLSAKKASKKAGAKNGFATTGIIFSILSWVVPIAILLIIVVAFILTEYLNIPMDTYAMVEMAEMAGAM